MRIFLGIFLVIALLSTSSSVVYALDDKIIAVVNDDIITLSEMADFLSSIYVQLSSSGKSEQEIMEQMREYEEKGLNKLIEEKLLVDEADKSGMVINEAAIDTRLKEIKDYYITDQNFRDALKKDGLTITDLINTITDQLKVKSIIYEEIRSKIFVSPQEITNFYQGNKDQFLTPRRVDLESIFIPYGDDKAQADKKAKEVFNLLKKEGSIFTDIAKEHSESPSVGIIEEGKFLPGIEKIVFNLNDGEMSQPIGTENGIFIFKLKAKYPVKQLTLEEAHDKIYNIIFKKEFDKRMNAWLKKLKEEAYIEIKG